EVRTAQEDAVKRCHRRLIDRSTNRLMEKTRGGSPRRAFFIDIPAQNCPKNARAATMQNGATSVP
ncbi:MAG: hypothetical protein AAB419_02470, partial [Pseudomonadota bacterium]